MGNPSARRLDVVPCASPRRSVLAACILAAAVTGGALADDFHVGPGHPYDTPNDVPWESLEAGDTVWIHHRAEPYRCKWVIAAAGTPEAPVTVRGVPGPDGVLPVIDGEDATTRLALNYWNENRSVIKIGGSSNPPDVRPTHIVIEHLDIRGANPDHTFTDDAGQVQTYASNAAAIHVQRGDVVTIRGCILRDSGNGLFIGSYAEQSTERVLIEGCFIHSNGIVGSAFEHNTYTEAVDIVYRYNRFGALRPGALGNNLKDRSAGLVVAYNWIEDGNRQLDLVEAYDRLLINGDPRYRRTDVFGNVLIESDGEGNSQVIHYGGDNGNPDTYRKGTLHLHHNTILSTRSGNTTLARLSTADETAEVRNNVVHVTAPGDRLAMLNGDGTMLLAHNWLTAGWVDAHGTAGTVIEGAGQLVGAAPGFRDLAAQDFVPLPGSPLVNTAGPPHPDTETLDRSYQFHRRSQPRPALDGTLDRGAFESREPADLDGDGEVGLGDLLALLADWGPCPLPPASCADVDGDGAIGIADLLELLAAWD